jgi:hypothetical protein
MLPSSSLFANGKNALRSSLLRTALGAPPMLEEAD